MKNAAFARWVPFGVAIGAGVGVAMKNIAVGVGLGARRTGRSARSTPPDTETVTVHVLSMLQ